MVEIEKDARAKGKNRGDRQVRPIVADDPRMKDEERNARYFEMEPKM